MAEKSSTVKSDKQTGKFIPKKSGSSEQSIKSPSSSRRRVRKIQSPAKSGRIKRSLIEKAVEEVIAERS